MHMRRCMPGCAGGAAAAGCLPLLRPRAAKSFTAAVRRSTAAGATGPRRGRRAAATAGAATSITSDHPLAVSEEDIPGSRVRCTITVPAAAIKRAYTKVLAEYNAKVAVAGYRKGKAPEAALVDALGGRARVANTVMSDVIEAAMSEALGGSQRAQTALADTEAIEQSAAELESRFSPASDFTFSVTYDVLPHVMWRTPHRELSVAVEAAPDDAKVAALAAAKLRAVLKETGKMRVVAGRGLRRGDVAIVDFEATDAASGAPLATLARKAMRLDTELADEEFLPGVVEAMEGMAAGEEREHTLTIPDDAGAGRAAGGSLASLRGVRASARVKVTELFEWDLPEADDEWAARAMGPGSTLSDVKERLEANTRAEGEDLLRQRIADAFTSAVAGAVEVDVPDSLIMELGRNEYSRELSQAAQAGKLSFEMVEQLAVPQLVHAYVEKKRPELVELQKAALGFADILALEGLTVDEALVEAETRAALDSVASGLAASEIDEAGVKETVVQSLQTQAAMDWLVANCTVALTPAP